MTQDEILTALKQYQDELLAILRRFRKSQSGIDIDSADNFRVRAVVTEALDLLSDFVPASQRHQTLIVQSYNQGISNFTESCSYASVKEIHDTLGTVAARLERNPALLQQPTEVEANRPSEAALLDVIENLLLRYHAVAVQLRKRRQNRDTIDINDEYDVQDLLHALLREHFDDIRPEEWNPSYAGGSSRTDFLLPSIDTFIEVKMTRKGLADREIGEQLIVDIEKYQSHPQCRRLICFVYDPSGYIANPSGIENDLHSKNRDIELQVIISPKQT